MADLEDKLDKILDKVTAIEVSLAHTTELQIALAEKVKDHADDLYGNGTVGIKQTAALNAIAIAAIEKRCDKALCAAPPWYARMAEKIGVNMATAILTFLGGLLVWAIVAREVAKVIKP